MLVVETISKIRRWYFQEGRPIKQIGRDLGVSRKTVRKVIRSGATEFSYERSVQPQPKIGPWREELDRMLADNAGRPKRERLTRIRVFEELRGQGYEGGDGRGPALCGRVVEGNVGGIGGCLGAVAQDAHLWCDALIRAKPSSSTGAMRWRSSTA